MKLSAGLFCFPWATGRLAMKCVAIVFGCSLVLAHGRLLADNRNNPGLNGVANASTDIVVAEVLETSPRKAIEGARDTATFKVVRTLKGPLQPGDEAGVYYHLLWIDTEKWILEPPKFEKGKRYTIFLVKDSLTDHHYTLADQWQAVLPNHPALDKDVALSLNEVNGLWSDSSRNKHKQNSGNGAIASSMRIEILPEGKVTRTKQGLSLPVKIVNHTTQAITTRPSHEWHGGKWPSTDLYASVTPVQTKEVRLFQPVYLIGEKQGESIPTRIEPGKSATVELRMDWAGTVSVPGMPLLTTADREAVVRVLIVFDVGRNALEFATSAAQRVKVVAE